MYCARFACMLLFTAAVVSAQTCPAFTKKNAIRIAAADLAVDGWYAYARGTTLCWSSLRKVDEQVISNTGIEMREGVMDIDISPDGNWILYLAKAAPKSMVITNRDGTSFTAYSDPNQINHVAFYRNAPGGKLKVAYTKNFIDKACVFALDIDLSGAKPVFGANPVKIADLSPNLAGFNGEVNVNGNHIFARSMSKAYCITIPPGGIARWENVYNVAYTFECGLTMNPSGDKVCSNQDNNAAGVECFPEGHKGLNVYPFKEMGRDPVVSMETWLMRDGISFNWSPYTFGGKGELDFSFYYWSNHEDWIAAELTGSKSPETGVWLVNWKRNEWTALTGDNVRSLARDPAVYLTSATKADPRVPAALRSVRRTDAGSRHEFDLTGRNIAKNAAARGVILKSTTTRQLSPSVNGL